MSRISNILAEILKTFPLLSVMMAFPYLLFNFQLENLSSTIKPMEKKENMGSERTIQSNKTYYVHICKITWFDT